MQAYFGWEKKRKREGECLYGSGSSSSSSREVEVKLNRHAATLLASHDEPARNQRLSHFQR